MRAFHHSQQEQEWLEGGRKVAITRGTSFAFRTTHLVGSESRNIPMVPQRERQDWWPQGDLMRKQGFKENEMGEIPKQM